MADLPTGGVISEIATAITAVLGTLATLFGAKKVRERMGGSTQHDHCLEMDRFNAIAARIAQIEERAMAVDAKLSQAEFIYGRMESVMTKLETSLDRVHERIDRVDQRLSNMEGYNAATRGST